MKKLLKSNLVVLIYAVIFATNAFSQNDITIENIEMRLVLSENGFAKSLIHKATNQECLAFKDSVPVFAVKQFDRLIGQEMLIHILILELIHAQ